MMEARIARKAASLDHWGSRHRNEQYLLMSVSQQLGRLVAIHDGHVDVHHDDIRPEGIREDDRRLTVKGNHCLVPPSLYDEPK